MNIERIEAVLARTATFPRFDMTSWTYCLKGVVHDCFPETTNYDYSQIALFLGLEVYQLQKMFKPSYDTARCATRVDASNMLTYLLETGEVEWYEY